MSYSIEKEGVGSRVGGELAIVSKIIEQKGGSDVLAMLSELIEFNDDLFSKYGYGADHEYAFKNPSEWPKDILKAFAGKYKGEVKVGKLEVDVVGETGDEELVQVTGSPQEKMRKNAVWADAFALVRGETGLIDDRVKENQKAFEEGREGDVGGPSFSQILEPLSKLSLGELEILKKDLPSKVEIIKEALDRITKEALDEFGLVKKLGNDLVRAEIDLNNFPPDTPEALELKLDYKRAEESFYKAATGKSYTPYLRFLDYVRANNEYDEARARNEQSKKPDFYGSSFNRFGRDTPFVENASKAATANGVLLNIVFGPDQTFRSPEEIEKLVKFVENYQPDVKK